MSDILEELTRARPVDLDRTAPGWDLRREQLLAELDDKVSAQPERDKRSIGRHGRALVVLAARRLGTSPAAGNAVPDAPPAG